MASGRWGTAVAAAFDGDGRAPGLGMGSSVLDAGTDEGLKHPAVLAKTACPMLHNKTLETTQHSATQRNTIKHQT